MVAEDEIWKRCSSCKKPIAFRSQYYQCSVSTCTRKRTGFSFCSVDCWETHLPMMRHREAWAVEEQAPTKEQWAREQAEDGDDAPAKREAPRAAEKPAPAPSVLRRESGGDGPRRIAVPATPAAAPAPREVLVIASRLKDYIRQRYGMNTSDGVLEPLSDQLRALCDRAVLHARDDGRKTLLDRDFAFLTEKR
jgi:hypothetical protein